MKLDEQTGIAVSRGSRWAMSRANIRTSSTMCCWATRMRCRRAMLHPIFYGSFDWHSCVHGWWTLLTLRRLFPGQ